MRQRNHRAAGALASMVAALALVAIATPGMAAKSAKPAKSTKSAPATRTEHDLLGSKEVPADAYYGIQTARALENFQLSGVAINHYPGFV